MDFLVPTADQEEERKRITSKVLHGDTMVLIDNIDKPFGSAVLEALLTTGTWSDRQLSTNNAPSLDVWITWYASGNNVQFKRTDTQRRCCVVRLLTKDIRPEQRSGFKHPDLEKHVLAHRGELLGAALTLLRAWIRAGKEAPELPGWGGTWGSFNSWDQVVRGAIVYAGFADPIAAKPTNSATEIVQKGLRELVEGLEEAAQTLGNGEVQVQMIKDEMKADEEKRRTYKDFPLRFKKLREAISAFLPYLPDGQMPNAVKLGELFGRNKHMPTLTDQGIKWINFRKRDGYQYWRVEIVPSTSGDTGSAIETIPQYEVEYSDVGLDDRCVRCGDSPHRPCGRCDRCPAEIGGCSCRQCIKGSGGRYIQTTACNLCSSWQCRCSRCGECRTLTPVQGGCCC